MQADTRDAAVIHVFLPAGAHRFQLHKHAQSANRKREARPIAAFIVDIFGLPLVARPCRPSPSTARRRPSSAGRPCSARWLQRSTGSSVLRRHAGGGVKFTGGGMLIDGGHLRALGLSGEQARRAVISARADAP